MRKENELNRKDSRRVILFDPKTLKVVYVSGASDNLVEIIDSFQGRGFWVLGTEGMHLLHLANQLSA